MLLTVLQNFTVADCISSISAVASFITAIIALLTVREVKKQREHSYHPDLNLANFDFFVYKYDNEESKVGDHEEQEDIISLYYSKTRLPESQPKTGYNELTININNIGFGVAKAINYEWAFDLDNARNVLEADSFKLNKESFNIVFKKLNVNWSYELNEENHGNFVNFILPYSIENRTFEIRIPTYFMDLFWVYLAKGMLTKDVSIGDNFPPLVLSINYENIHGKIIKKVFSIQIWFIFISSPKTEKNELANFKFEIKEIHL